MTNRERAIAYLESPWHEAGRDPHIYEIERMLDEAERRGAEREQEELRNTQWLFMALVIQSGGSVRLTTNALHAARKEQIISRGTDADGSMVFTIEQEPGDGGGE